MKWLTLSLLLVCSLQCASAPPKDLTPPEPKASESTLVVDADIPIQSLQGPGKIMAVLVPLQVPDGDAPIALLRFSGMDSPIAGVPLLATRILSGTTSVTWTVRLDGRTLTVLSTWANKPGITFLDLPAMGTSPEAIEYSLRPDDQLVGTVDANAMLAVYEKKLADGSVAELERFHRKPKLLLKAQQIEEKRAMLAKSCGTPIALTVDWTAIPDDELASSTHCYGLLHALDDVCQRDEAGRRALVSGVKEVHCQRGESESLTVDADKILQVSETNRMAGPSDSTNAKHHAYPQLIKLLKLTKTVLKTADGMIVVLDPDLESKEVYVGREETFYLQWTSASSKTVRSIWSGTRTSNLQRVGLGKWKAKCDSRILEFVEVSDTFRLQTLAKASFLPRLWKREAFALARDDRGTYYFVDRLAKQLGAKGYRVFKGPRGAAKLTKLVDIVDDSGGMIFATTKGKLRLVLGKDGTPEARWIKGRKERELVSLSVGKNRKFIYGDLGAYEGAQLGSICDL